MTDQSLTPGGAENQPLPDCPELAMFLAATFQRLGGFLTTDSNGKRGYGRPCQPQEFAQMPGARPCEQFHTADEWNGAIKLIDYWIHRLSCRDRDFIFTYCGGFVVDPGKTFDFREFLK